MPAYKIREMIYVLQVTPVGERKSNIVYTTIITSVSITTTTTTITVYYYSE